MAARIIEAVAISDDDAGVELRVLSAAGGGVQVEVRMHPIAEEGDGVHQTTTRMLTLDEDTANELRLGIQRAAKPAGAK